MAAVPYLQAQWLLQASVDHDDCFRPPSVSDYTMAMLMTELSISKLPCLQRVYMAGFVFVCIAYKRPDKMAEGSCPEDLQRDVKPRR